MNCKRILITGGAGFVGSHVAVRLRQSYPDCAVTVLDNLLRRGSELNLSRLKQHGVSFHHGDIRCPEDLEAVPAFDLLIECSAEPSVHAGQQGSPYALVNNNLIGAVHCLEAARKNDAALLFLSTSRIYPIEALNSMRYSEGPTRFVLDTEQDLPGCSEEGLNESFPLDGARSFYGATKLAGELLIQEYVFSYGMRAMINRCGVIAGPGQMGKVDQGVVTLWVARHHYGKQLCYTGFGGTGKQVRDILHVEDLFTLLERQLMHVDTWNGRVYNVGGGLGCSTSIHELTDMCRNSTSKSVEISGQADTAAVDVRIYLTDARQVREEFNWEPAKGPQDIVNGIAEWIRANEDQLASILAP